jgi:hypothetical protein
MKKFIALIALSILVAPPAMADRWLKDNSYVCTNDILLQRLAERIAVGDWDGAKKIKAQGCYLIGNAARVIIDYTEGNKVMFFVPGTPQAPPLWTWANNISDMP